MFIPITLLTMKNNYKQIIRRLKLRIKAVTPGRNAARGAGLGVLIGTALLWLAFTLLLYNGIRDLWVFLPGIAIVLAAVLFAFTVRWGIRRLNDLPGFYILALLTATPLLYIMSFDWMIPVLFLVLASLTGAVVLVLRKTGFQNLSGPKKTITILGLLIGFGGLIAVSVVYRMQGFDVAPIINASQSTASDMEQIQAVSPGENGPFPVKTVTYGSGNDFHRPEYGAEAGLITHPVDGLAFIDNWDGFGGWYREKYWGFDSRALPLNASVWYPQGEGPFPLALVVHGNHSMQDFSDPGYDYLGELLASRGIILASVDENFLNASWSDLFGGLEKENDARGWLLLEHLKVWHTWNRTEGHLFCNKIDTTRLALIGHSRGGEAVAHAALFNRLPFYPDDASVKFDYNYNIKSIVAIAPADGQYEPGKSRTAIENVSYFVLQGAQDADVSSFMGSQQYERVTFNDSLYHLKSGLYVYGANHGQFNTGWGNNDMGIPSKGLLNLKQLLPADAQQQIAKVYISAFLEVTLNNRNEYLPLFRDARTAKAWLPETIYLSQFEDSNTEFLCTFDEDFNVTTPTRPGDISSRNLTVWREQEIELKWQKKGSRALFIGWNYTLENEKDSIDSVADSLIASYTIRLSPNPVDFSEALVFSMAESRESANPKSEGKWVKIRGNEKNEGEEKKQEEKKKGKEDIKDTEEKEEVKKPIDFTIELIDASGQNVSFPLSKFSPLQREIEVVMKKTEFINNGKQSEKVFQTFCFPAKDFQELNPYFNLSDLESIRFIFDKSESGVVAVDNIGIMKKGLGEIGGNAL